MCGASTVSTIKDIVGIGSAVASAGMAAKSLFTSQPKAASVNIPEDTSEADAQAAAEKERRRLLLARGSKSTNVTGGKYEDGSLFISPTLGGR